MQKNNDETRLYYELTLSIPSTAPHDRLLPITFMISADHSQTTLDMWMMKFRYGFKQVFGRKDFPNPRIIISDRSYVLIRASLHQFNNETYPEYLNRTFKMVNGAYRGTDHSKTIIHSCLSHLMCHFRKKIVNKMVVKELRELVM
ncbi:unnamed protein product [Didymodactylos carnosus]|uniref:Uncharacterized protein n=1 Tax=Didymodactylos carnosus TaxID=1234261 RepID=A0A8S2XAZ9_9BILA|nr:unnamed protein product [Didymodactylos carnosus]CAF4487437.1 unnamed protein product [Didymodactylos carnosus]